MSKKADPRISNYGRSYFPHEDALILSNKPLKQIAIILDRTTNAIGQRRQRLLHGHGPQGEDRKRKQSFGTWLSVPLIRAVRAEAERRRCTIQSLVETALKEYLDAHKE